jgi:UDP-glucose 4-epimerase
MLQRASKIVVTGGAGFIGSHLVRHLLETYQAEVVVFDQPLFGWPESLACLETERHLRLVQGDVRDPDAVASALRGADLVYHLAARRTLAAPDDEIGELFTTNVVGTFNVLQAAARSATARLVFASYRDAYGEPVSLPVDEDHPLLTSSFYGASKAAGEEYCRAFRRVCGLQTVILRLADVYGPGDGSRLIPSWLECAAAGRELPVHDGRQVVDFLWVGQAVEALIRAAELDGPLPPINVASGTGTRIVDVARRIAGLVGGQVRVKLLPARSTDVSRFIANVDRMRQILRIEPPLDPLVHLPSLLPTVAPLGAAR